MNRMDSEILLRNQCRRVIQEVKVEIWDRVRCCESIVHNRESGEFHPYPYRYELKICVGWCERFTTELHPGYLWSIRVWLKGYENFRCCEIAMNTSEQAHKYIAKGKTESIFKMKAFIWVKIYVRKSNLQVRSSRTQIRVL